MASCTGGPPATAASAPATRSPSAWRRSWPRCSATRCSAAAGLDKFASTWPHFLIAYVGGIGLLAQLFQDVVEREQLYAAQRRFRALLDEASEAIRIIEPETRRILETNRADSALSGMSRESLLGRDGRDFWPEDADGRARWEALVAESATVGVASGFGLPYRGAGGAIRSVDITLRRVEHDGRAYEIVMFRDAGPREALDAARREVLDLRAITLVANAAAHEINNPLTVIVGSIELLQRRLSGDQSEVQVGRPGHRVGPANPGDHRPHDPHHPRGGLRHVPGRAGHARHPALQRRQLSTTD